MRVYSPSLSEGKETHTQDLNRRKALTKKKNRPRCRDGTRRIICLRKTGLSDYLHRLGTPAQHEITRQGREKVGRKAAKHSHTAVPL